MNINIIKTRSTLNQLNAILRQKCKSLLSIKIYSGSELTTDILDMTYDKQGTIDFVICLDYRYECVSSIACKINPDTHCVEFSSKTHKDHEGNKYNLLLRSAFILLCPHITYNDGQHITTILSRAINPISIYLMVKYFYSENDKLTKYMNDNNLNNDTLTYDDAVDFYENVDFIDMDENEDEESALKNNPDFGTPISLTIDLTNTSFLRRATKIFKDLSIICPKIGGYKNRSKKNRSKKNRSKNKRTHKKRTHKKRYNKYV